MHGVIAVTDVRAGYVVAGVCESVGMELLRSEIVLARKFR